MIALNLTNRYTASRKCFFRGGGGAADSFNVFQKVATIFLPCAFLDDIMSFNPLCSIFYYNPLLLKFCHNYAFKQGISPLAKDINYAYSQWRSQGHVLGGGVVLRANLAV